MCKIISNAALCKIISHAALCKNIYNSALCKTITFAVLCTIVSYAVLCTVMLCFWNCIVHTEVMYIREDCTPRISSITSYFHEQILALVILRLNKKSFQFVSRGCIMSSMKFQPKMSSHNLNSCSKLIKCKTSLRLALVWLELQSCICFHKTLWHYPQRILTSLQHWKKCCHVI